MLTNNDDKPSACINTKKEKEGQNKSQKSIQNKIITPDIPSSPIDTKNNQRLDLKKVFSAIGVIIVISFIITGLSLLTKNQPVKLRDKPATLSKADVDAMMKKYHFVTANWYDWWKFNNDFKDNGNGTVTDHKTGLTWQQSGSDASMQYKDIDDYIRKLNRKGLGGYNDWGMPTLEELASLLERQKMNGRYIDPIFDNNQRWCWSADKYKGSAWSAWFVGFNYGYVDYSVFDDDFYVRLVRAGQ